jgi:hypothetical protein
MAKLTPAAFPVVDGPVTMSALRAELAAFKRDMIAALQEALADGRTVADASLHRRVESLERAYRGEQPTLSEDLEAIVSTGRG